MVIQSETLKGKDTVTDTTTHDFFYFLFFYISPPPLPQS